MPTDDLFAGPDVVLWGDWGQASAGKGTIVYDPTLRRLILDPNHSRMDAWALVRIIASIMTATLKPLPPPTTLDRAFKCSGQPLTATSTVSFAARRLHGAVLAAERVKYPSCRLQEREVVGIFGRRMKSRDVA